MSRLSLLLAWHRLGCRKQSAPPPWPWEPADTATLAADLDELGERLIRETERLAREARRQP